MKLVYNWDMRKIWLVLVGCLFVGGVFYQERGRILGFRELIEKKQRIKLVTVGDVMLGRSVNTAMVRRKDWKYPFLEVGEYLQRADIVFGNLESPFGESCPYTDVGMIFCADKRSVEGLVWSGFGVMSLENNHSLNQGVRGYELSESWLEENEIRGLSRDEVEIIETGGLKVGFLAFDDVSKRIDQKKMIELVLDTKRKVDVVVVSVHWGWEYRDKPNERQVILGRAMVDNGADVVLGHHPHWIQTVEEYKNGVIVYSLGNFVFDQMWSEETRLGLVGEFWLGKNGVEDYGFKRVKIFEYSQPRWEEE